MATYQITINERTKEGKELLAQLQKNKTVQFKQKEKLSYPPVITKAELKKIIAQAHRDQKAGRCIEVAPKDFKKFLGLE